MTESTPTTIVQKQFLLSVVRAIIKKRSAVSTVEIKEVHGRSESCVRNHVVRMEDRGFMVLVGKSDHRQMFAPTRAGMQEIDGELIEEAKINPIYDVIRRQNIFCIGGQCQDPCCVNPAEDFYRGKFFCRDHIMGCSPKEDMVNLHCDHEALWGAQSIAGDVSDLVVMDGSFFDNE